MESWVDFVVINCGLFQYECKFTGMATSEIQKEAYAVLMSFGDSVVSHSGSAVASALKTACYVIFKYIITWAYQAELRPLVYYPHTASFCNLEVDRHFSSFKCPVYDVENGNWVRTVGYTFRKK